MGGNKPDLLARYRQWWTSQLGATAGPSVGAAGPSTTGPPAPAATPESTTETILDISGSVGTVPMLARLLVPKKLKLSAVTRECVQKLRYTPGKDFRNKAREKDFSEVLKPLQLFVDVFLKTMAEVRVTSEAGENESALRQFLQDRLPKVRAAAELSHFFAAWGIEVTTNSDGSPLSHGAEYDTQMQMALEMSRVTAQAEAEQRHVDEAEVEAMSLEEEDNRKALLQELDVINCALQHRLVRWSTKLPERSVADQLWPTTFSTEDRKAIRKFVHEYMTSHELTDAELSEQAKLAAIAEMQYDEDFPVNLGRSASVIKAVLLESRFGEARRSRSRSESQVTQTPSVASRSLSPVKRMRRLGRDEEEEAMEAMEASDDGDEEGEEEVVQRGKKRPRRSRSSVSYVEDLAAQVEDDDDTTYMDHQGPSLKRSRRRISKSKEIAQSLAEDEEMG
jgi:hypothetical protein